MIAVVPVRQGELPAGGAEAVAEAGGDAVVVGEAAATAAADLAGVATRVRAWDTPGFAPGRWAVRLAGLLADEDVVILPASPDGRDLAPRLAAELGHTLLAGAVEVRPGRVTTVGFHGTLMSDHTVADPVVVTLQPGVRGVQEHGAAAPAVEEVDLDAGGPDDGPPEVEVLEILPPDVTTMDLSEAPRILGGGAGLDGPDRFAQLTRIATAMDASVGTTRVVTDKGWLPHSRQIGTTGVVVDPDLYVAFAISGAVQHTSGLGQPDHVISVNTEPHCPMMALADLAIVADANETLDELERLLAAGAASSGAASSGAASSGAASSGAAGGGAR